MLDTSARICYPGPLYRDDRDESGVVVGRTLVQEGPIWLVERPVVTMHTITPVEQWGIWDARIMCSTSRTGPATSVSCPGGKHDNVLGVRGLRRPDGLHAARSGTCATSGAPRSEAERRLQARTGKWLADESNRQVGPVEWERIRVNDNVSALEPTIIDDD